jgi:hypothetical protein
LKGTTFDDVLDPLFVGCTMTCVAVIVVLSVVPTTRAVSPLVTALADAEFVPFSYVVDDVSLTVTFSPADVNSPKPDVDTLLTLPIDPPAAGPDRALDPPPPDPEGATCAAVVEGVVAATEVDVPPQAESPITGISSPAMTHLLFLLDRTRRNLERPAGCPEVALVPWWLVSW